MLFTPFSSIICNITSNILQGELWRGAWPSDPVQNRWIKLLASLPGCAVKRRISYIGLHREILISALSINNDCRFVALEGHSTSKPNQKYRFEYLNEGRAEGRPPSWGSCSQKILKTFCERSGDLFADTRGTNRYFAPSVPLYKKDRCNFLLNVTVGGISTEILSRTYFYGVYNWFTDITVLLSRQTSGVAIYILTKYLFLEKGMSTFPWKSQLC